MALTADTKIKTVKLTDFEGFKVDVPVAASTTIYRDGWVGLNESGYLEMFEPFTAGATEVGNRFFGLALEGVNNSSGSDGDLLCEVLVDGCVRYVLSGRTEANRGNPVFVSDDDTLAKEASNAYLGTIADIVGVSGVVARFNGMKPSTPLICRVTPELDFTVLNQVVPVIHRTENHNGLLVLWSGAYCTEAHVCGLTQGLALMFGTDDVQLAVINLTANGHAVGDLIQGTGDAFGASSGDATKIVPAGEGAYVKMLVASTDGGTASGKARIIVIAIPIA